MYFSWHTFWTDRSIRPLLTLWAATGCLPTGRCHVGGMLSWGGGPTLIWAPLRSSCVVSDHFHFCHSGWKHLTVRSGCRKTEMSFDTVASGAESGWMSPYLEHWMTWAIPEGFPQRASVYLSPIHGHIPIPSPDEEISINCSLTVRNSFQHQCGHNLTKACEWRYYIWLWDNSITECQLCGYGFKQHTISCLWVCRSTWAWLHLLQYIL